MSTMTGLDVFDTTVHKTNVWLKEIMEEINSENHHQAYLALRAVLQSLRDRLTVEEAAQLGAQLPMLIRGIYYEAWRPVDKPLKERSKEEFLSHINDYFRNEPVADAECIARGVFRVLAKRVSEGEIEDVKALMPKQLLDLWD